ncbi:hypothetical protein IAD21_05998 [Abditibacteriota bacterium]|nr:hypothetical protein IAD21_00724 [Abditibacteriota bacterium]BCM94059.1 hypothetical protein IAD21_05956 [Abditibacteriota bacterium]BCM94098.1 hypothetical protein IAD21_05998 [Abditibacteriota bacterium]
MLLPTQTDYKRVLDVLVGHLEAQPRERLCLGRPFTYPQRTLLRCFLFLHLRRLHTFKAQHRWLLLHPEQAQAWGLEVIPHRTTLLRRYRQLAPFLDELIASNAQWAQDLGQAPSSEPLEEPDYAPPARSCIEDKSLFRASGPVWHQKNRVAGVVPTGLRRLDRDASWSKSAYHGWVYGYGLHLTVDAHSFPLLAQVETASVSESQVVGEKAPTLLSWRPTEVVSDSAYTHLERVKAWARQGVVLLSAGLKLGTKGEAGAYRRFIAQEENQKLLRARKTQIEPAFDLISKVAGTTQNHKQLPIQGLPKVRAFLLLCVLLTQLAMILNRVWGLPLRNISHMMAVLT